MKPKALFILHLPPPVHGSSMVGMQIKNSKLINDNFDASYVNLNTSLNVNQIGKLNLSKIKTYLNILYIVFLHLIKNKYSIVYIAPTVSGGGFYKDFWVVALVKIFHYKKIFLHLHNKGCSKNKGKLNTFLYRIFFKNTVVILLSKLLYVDIKEYVKEDQIRICPNGIDVTSLIESDFNTRVTNESINILYLSNLIKSKGIFDLIDACKILKENNVPFICNLVGGEGDISIDSLSEYIKLLDLVNEVKYLGKKYDEEKKEIFLKSEIFIQPTLNDVLPLVIIEAMQFKLPVISTNEGGIPDLVIDNYNGFIVDKNNPRMLAERLEVLISNKQLREELGNNGEKLFFEKYTFDQFESNLFEILKNN